jgi:hypothetical protein
MSELQRLANIQAITAALRAGFPAGTLIDQGEDDITAFHRFVVRDLDKGPVRVRVSRDALETMASELLIRHLRQFWPVIATTSRERTLTVTMAEPAGPPTIIRNHAAW